MAGRRASGSIGFAAQRMKKVEAITTPSKLDATEVDQAPSAAAENRTHVRLTGTDALNVAALDRVRRVLVMLIVICMVVGSGVAAQSLGTKPAWFLLGAMVLSVLLSGGVLLFLSLREGAAPPDSMLLVAAFALPGGVANFAIFSYFGFFSYVHGVTASTLYGVTVGAPRKVALFSYLTMASVPAIGMFGIALGWLPDNGRIRPIGTLGELLFTAAVVQLIYFGVFLLARHASAVAEKAVRDLEEAHRAVEQRDAVLDEVRDDIARVMQGGGPASGKIFGGWKLGAVLGRGGMGEVYEAQSTTSAQTAAVKLLLLDDGMDEELQARFRREAEAMRRLDHPHVVKLLEVGDGFIAMEHLRGQDLAAILRERPQLPPEEVAEMVKQVASALEAARAADVVHRDLKPHNLFFVAAERTWKVLDFGISKLGSSATLTQGVIGTPAYMAPEHIDGTPVTHVTDVFSLALVAYRAVTGRPAFSGNDPKVLSDVLDAMPAQPSAVASLGEDVELAIALAIAKAPRDRIATAVAFAAAFEAAIHGALAPDLRERARRLVREHGWGQRRDQP